jgi:biotin carboxyl carrier protein
VAPVTDTAPQASARWDSGALRVSLVAAGEPTAFVVEPGADGASPSVDGRVAHASVVRLDRRRALFVATDPPEHGERPEHGADRARRRLLLGEPVVGRGRSALVRREIVVDGWRVEVEIEPERWAALRDRTARGRREGGPHGSTELRAIIPGVVVSVAVAAGDEVATGQPLLVIEAMKMQNELRAPRDGRIERVAAGAGSRVELGELLLVLE